MEAAQASFAMRYGIMPLTEEELIPKVEDVLGILLDDTLPSPSPQQLREKFTVLVDTLQFEFFHHKVTIKQQLNRCGWSAAHPGADQHRRSSMAVCSHHDAIHGEIGRTVL